MSEETLIRHCSPTLAGIKTANLFTSEYGSEQELRSTIRDLNSRLNPRGIRVIPLRYQKGRVLVYVYRPGFLSRDLRGARTREMLASRGYDCESEGHCVAQLRQRLLQGAQFPHEIGLFLGYPPEDVRCFMEHREAELKFVGFWKVYSDEDTARRTFERYRKCTDVYLDQYSTGRPLEKLAVKCR